jgi:hypothetical protein
MEYTLLDRLNQMDLLKIPGTTQSVQQTWHTRFFDPDGKDLSGVPLQMSMYVF